MRCAIWISCSCWAIVLLSPSLSSSSSPTLLLCSTSTILFYSLSDSQAEAIFVVRICDTAAHCKIAYITINAIPSHVRVTKRAETIASARRRNSGEFSTFLLNIFIHKIVAPQNTCHNLFFVNIKISMLTRRFFVRIKFRWFLIDFSGLIAIVVRQTYRLDV